jgi:biopolymer transport protein TolR
MNEEHDLFAKTGGAQMQSEINVTPLVDVCLVLLIIFMVVTPMLQEGVDVELPTAGKPDAMPEEENQLTLAIDSKGDTYVGDLQVPPEDLKATLTNIYRLKPNRPVVLKGQRDLRYRQVRDFMKNVNEAGFTEVGLVLASSSPTAAFTAQQKDKEE